MHKCVCFPTQTNKALQHAKTRFQHFQQLWPHPIPPDTHTLCLPAQTPHPSPHFQHKPTTRVCGTENTSSTDTETVRHCACPPAWRLDRQTAQKSQALGHIQSVSHKGGCCPQTRTPCARRLRYHVTPMPSTQPQSQPPRPARPANPHNPALANTCRQKPKQQKNKLLLLLLHAPTPRHPTAAAIHSTPLR